MSDMLVSGKNFFITKYVMSDDIDDIQDPRYHMGHRTFFQPITSVPGIISHETSDIFSTYY